MDIQAIISQYLPVILSNYNIGPGVNNNVELSKIQAGQQNNNYIISIAGKPAYVLTAHMGTKWFDGDYTRQIENYMGYATHLNDKGLPTPRILESSQQNTYTMQIPGMDNIPMTVAEYIPHIHVESDYQKDTQYYQAIGQTMAEMHLAVADCHLEYAPSLTTEKLSQQNPNLLPEGYTKPPTANLPAALCHLDLKPDNFSYDPATTSIYAIFDPNRSGIAPMVEDLAHTVFFCCTTNGQLNTDTSQIIISSYSQIRPLTMPETKVLPSLIRNVASKIFLLGELEAKSLANFSDLSFESTLSISLR